MKKVLMMCVVLGFAAVSQAVLVDNFDSYAAGSVNAVANPPWAELGNTAAMGATINNGYLTVKPGAGDGISADPTNTVYKGISPIANTDTATTLYFRLRADSITTNSSIGLSAMATPTLGFGDFNAQIRVNSANSLPSFNVRNGGSFTTGYALNVSQWYNVWAVINQSTDKFDVYLTTGSDDAITGTILYSVSQAGFRVGTTADLVNFLVMSQGSKLTPNDNQLSIDDIYISSGVNLTIPEPITILVLGLGSLYLRKRK